MLCAFSEEANTFWAFAQLGDNVCELFIFLVLPPCPLRFRSWKCDSLFNDETGRSLSSCVLVRESIFFRSALAQVFCLFVSFGFSTWKIDRHLREGNKDGPFPSLQKSREAKDVQKTPGGVFGSRVICWFGATFLPLSISAVDKRRSPVVALEIPRERAAGNSSVSSWSRKCFFCFAPLLPLSCLSLLTFLCSAAQMAKSAFGN